MQCKVCIEKERQIGFLKELLDRNLADKDKYRKQIDEIYERQFEILEHYTGARYAQAQMRRDKDEPEELRRIRRSNPISSRIARAEQASVNPAAREQRDREYRARVEQLMNPELIVLEREEDKDAEVPGTQA